MITGNTLYAPQYEFKNDANFWQIFQSLLNVKYCNCYKCVTIIYMHFPFIAVVIKFNTNSTTLCIILQNLREIYISNAYTDVKTTTSSSKCISTKLDIYC